MVAGVVIFFGKYFSDRYLPVVQSLYENDAFMEAGWLAESLKLALKISGGRVVRAAELLGITRHALRRKLEKFGLNDLRVRYDNSDNIPNLGPGPGPLNG